MKEKRRPREEAVIYALLAALFLTVTLLAVFLIRAEQKRDRLLMEYQAERNAAALLEYFQEAGALPPQGVKGSVLGFGLYGFQGEPLLRVGTAPASLPPTERPSGRASFRFDGQRGSLRMVREVGFAPPGGSGMARRMQRMMGRMAGPQVVFLEMDTAGFVQRQRLMQAAALGVPVMVFGAIVALAFLYRRNLEYRRRIASQEQLARLGEVTRTLSHEIKNPLSAIRIQTGLLKKTLPGAHHRDLAIIEEEIGRLSVLTDRIGDFLRDPRGSPELLDLGEFARNLLRRYPQRAVLRDSEEAEIWVRFDRERLRSVLENLIGNALESTEEKGIGEPVEVQVAAGRSRAELAVMDRGGGIPREARERIFEPFYTSKTKGSGIGLSIVRRFVEAAGGTLSYADRKGGGTTATVSLKRERMEGA